MHIFIHSPIHNNNSSSKSSNIAIEEWGTRANRRVQKWDVQRKAQEQQDSGPEHIEKQIKLYQPIKLVTARLQIVQQHSARMRAAGWKRASERLEIKRNFNFCFASNSSFIFHSTWSFHSFSLFSCRFVGNFFFIFGDQSEKPSKQDGCKTLTCFNNKFSCPKSIFVRKSFPFQDHNVVYFTLV